MTAGHGERGQALVEFAFASLVFLTLFFGIVEFGRALFAYNEVAQAARVGSRYAMVNTPPVPNDCTSYSGTCQTAIRAAIAATGIDMTKLKANSPTITYGPTTVCASGPVYGSCWVNVDIAYTFTFVSLPSLPAQTLHSSSQVWLTHQ